MATASEAAEVATEATWINRVEIYRIGAAVAIMNEDPQTANHAERVAYATRVINGQDNLADYALGVAHNRLADIEKSAGAPDWGVADVDMNNAVIALFNAFAGVST